MRHVLSKIACNPSNWHRNQCIRLLTTKHHGSQLEQFGPLIRDEYATIRDSYRWFFLIFIPLNPGFPSFLLIHAFADSRKAQESDRTSPRAYGIR